MRRVYSSYVKGQIESQPESIIVLLPYYDTTDKAREILESKNIKVRELEKQGSLVIIDIMKVIRSLYFDVPDIERLRALITKTCKSISRQNYICNCRYVCLSPFEEVKGIIRIREITSQRYQGGEMEGIMPL